MAENNNVRRERPDLVGKVFGRLTIVEAWSEGKGTRCKCKCTCGNEVETKYAYLSNRHKQSCGCLQQESRENSQIKDLTGKRFGRLMVLRIDKDNRVAGRLKWICKCDCGTVLSVLGNNLTKGNTTSCGCYQHQRQKECHFKDLTGMRFGRLVAKEVYTGETNHKYPGTVWICQCDCGNTTKVETGNLMNGHTKSCGCLAEERRRTHGITATVDGKRISRIYISMKARCYRPSCNRYEYYGGKGITVCDEWLSKPGDKMNTGLVNFYEWSLSHGYAPGLSIDRIDNSKGYSPDNCRWVTPKEQMNNTSYNRHVVDADGEYLTFTQFEEKHELSKGAVYKAIRHRSLNAYVYSVNHPELGMHLKGKALIDKDGFTHLIPRYNKECISNGN